MTPQQAAILARPGPLGWIVITGDGFTAHFRDHTQALLYASHVVDGIVAPMVPEQRLMQPNQEPL